MIASRRHLRTWIAWAPVLALAAGCGGSGAGLDENGRPIGEGGGVGPLVATWRSIQDNVFTPKCTECHAGGAAPVGLRLDAAASYEGLVGVRSAQIPQLFRVEPGDPDTSYLVQKIEGAPGIAGGRMPLDRAPLEANEIAVIRQWIAEGAPRGEAPLPLRVTDVEPAPGATVGALAGDVTVTFNQMPDRATIGGATFVVERAGGDGTFGDGNEVALAADRFAFPSDDAATFDVGTQTPLVEDLYRVTLGGTDPAIRDPQGNALDGEFTGAFPSGNGTAGGDFVSTFTVSEPRLQVAALSVAPGSQTTGDLASIVVTFSREIDGATVDAGSFTLTGSGGDGIFGNGNDLPVAPLSVAATAAAQATLALGGGDPLADDLYRVRLDGTAAPIADLLGNALDGEFAGTFPSGDGAVGGDFVADFTVVNPVVDLLNVASFSPAPGSTVEGDLAAVVAGFDRAFDAATLDAATFLLAASGGDGTFGDGNETMIVPAGVAATAADEATFDLTGVGPLANDVYRATLVGTGGAPLRDTEGRALDGEFGGTFPSGDGEEGGDFRATFTVFTPPRTFVVTAMDPAPGDVVGELPRAPTLTMSRDVDEATLVGAVDLEASGGDGTFGDGNELRLTPGLATVGLGAANEIVIELSAFFPSLADTYRIVVRDAVEDAGGEALDGEFAGALPSGDGTAGGDFEATFEVRVLPTFASIQANVFGVTCTQCHFGEPEFAPEGLSLDADRSYDLLVGVSSTQRPALLRVDPGDPDASYLVRKLEGGPDIAGTRMPQFAEPLDEDVIAAIRQWIVDGANP